MKYELLEQAGRLEVSLCGAAPDLDALAIFQSHFQEIIDRVSYWIAVEEGLLPPARWDAGHSRRVRRSFRLGEPGYLVKGRVLAASSGSLIQEIGFALAVVVADPDMRAVLQNLAANVVWAIATSDVRGIQKSSAVPSRPQKDSRRNLLDPVDIGPNLRAATLALAESGQTAEIRVKSKGRNGEEHEVVISLSGND